jgi:hypothetical protein
MYIGLREVLFVQNIICKNIYIHFSLLMQILKNMYRFLYNFQINSIKF